MCYAVESAPKKPSIIGHGSRDLRQMKWQLGRHVQLYCKVGLQGILSDVRSIFSTLFGRWQQHCGHRHNHLMGPVGRVLSNFGKCIWSPPPTFAADCLFFAGQCGQPIKFPQSTGTLNGDGKLTGRGLTGGHGSASVGQEASTANKQTYPSALSNSFQIPFENVQ